MERRGFLGWVVGTLVTTIVTKLGFFGDKRPFRLIVTKTEMFDKLRFIFTCPKCQRKLALAPGADSLPPDTHLMTLQFYEDSALGSIVEAVRAIEGRETDICGTCDFCKAEYARLEKDLISRRKIRKRSGEWVDIRDMVRGPCQVIRLDLSKTS